MPPEVATQEEDKEVNIENGALRAMCEGGEVAREQSSLQVPSSSSSPTSSSPAFEVHVADWLQFVLGDISGGWESAPAQELLKFSQQVQSTVDLLDFVSSDTFKNTFKKLVEVGQSQQVLGDKGVKALTSTKEELKRTKNDLWYAHEAKKFIEVELRGIQQRMKKCRCDLSPQKAARKRSRDIIDEQRVSAKKFRESREEEMGSRSFGGAQGGEGKRRWDREALEAHREVKVADRGSRSSERARREGGKQRPSGRREREEELYLVRRVRK